MGQLTDQQGHDATLIIHANNVSNCNDYNYVGAPALGSSGGRGWGLGMGPAMAGVVDVVAVLDQVEVGIWRPTRGGDGAGAAL